MAGRKGKNSATKGRTSPASKRTADNDPIINSDGEENREDDGSDNEYQHYIKGKGDVVYSSSEDEYDSDDNNMKRRSKRKGQEKTNPAKKKHKQQASKGSMVTPRAVSAKKARPVPYLARVSSGGDDVVTPNEANLTILSTVASEHNAAALLADNATLRRQIQQIQEYIVPRGGKGKSVTRKMRREGLGSTDHLNIKELYNYINVQVWRYFKMMPRGWNKYRTEPMSTCAQMLSKVTVPNGMQPEIYWNNLIVAFANDKLCATRANFKMNLLKRYKGMCVQCFRMCCMACRKVYSFCY